MARRSTAAALLLSTTVRFPPMSLAGISPEALAWVALIAEYGGTLAVSNSQFASNLAGGGTNGSWGRGGAIYSASGSVSIVGDTFKLNKAGGDALGYGGAVFAVHAVTASTDTFTGNSPTAVRVELSHMAARSTRKARSQ